MVNFEQRIDSIKQKKPTVCENSIFRLSEVTEKTFKVEEIWRSILKVFAP